MATTQKQKTASGGSVAGSLNALIPGSIARDACWCAGRSLTLPMKPSCIWPVVCSAFNTVIAFFPYRFPNKLLEGATSKRRRHARFIALLHAMGP